MFFSNQASFISLLQRLFSFFALITITVFFALFFSVQTASANEILKITPENIVFELKANETKSAELTLDASHFLNDDFGNFVDYQIIKKAPLSIEQSFCQNINLIVDEKDGNDDVGQSGAGIGLLEKGVFWNPWADDDFEDIWTIQANTNNLKNGDYFCDLEIRVNSTGQIAFPILLQKLVKTAHAQTMLPQEVYTLAVTAHISGVKSGNSSIAFLPGIKASRLFVAGENQLWEPNRNNDVVNLKLNSDGTSKTPFVYTKTEASEGLIDEINVSPIGQTNIYKSLISDFDKMVTDGKIAQWKALPYDWRLSFDKILAGGSEINGKIYYENSGEYILKNIRELAENSDSGKVTIVAHSMGGLLAKKIVQTLADNGENIIDRIIFVAVPQLGTPVAIGSLLHGYDEGKMWGWVIEESTARDLAYDIESAYNLLPSKAYTERIFDVGGLNTKLIYFDDSLDSLDDNNLSILDLNFRKFYGENIFGYLKLQRFLSGEENRGQPTSDDLKHPLKLRESLLQKAKEYHDFYDDWTAPNNIKITQIAGWGISDTVKAFSYVTKSKKVCGVPSPQDTCPFFVKKYYLNAEPVFTWDGDEVVVVPSAIAQGGDTYFVDLPGYNLGFTRDRKHKNITEVKSVRDLIENIITKKENPAEDLNYITQDQTTLKADNKLIRLAMHSPVGVHIYDEFGNHTGLNAGDFEESIPGSYYIEFGGSKYLGIPAGQNYRIELEGTDTGSFTFELKEMLGDSVTNKRTFSNIPVTLKTTSTINLNNLSGLNKLEIDLDGDGVVDGVYEPDEPTARLETQMKITYFFYDGQDILAQAAKDAGDGLSPLLISELQDSAIDLEKYTSSGKILSGQKKKLKMKVKFLESAGNEYKNKSINIKFKFNAKQ